MTVYLVGAGPGDPGLITVRGAELLRQADVVVFDRLVHPDLVALAPSSAERISAGKAPKRPTMTQEQINELLVVRGLAGLEVVRLKGGDPFIFARGGEEAAALQAAGVRFEIVPGITSAIAAPAYAGIPATFRNESLSVTIVTGHEDPAGSAEVDWGALARVGGTIVVLMGAARARRIAAALIAGGLDPATPAATVQWGTHKHQLVKRLTLATLGAEPVPSPAAIVIGKVAAHDLAWFHPADATAG